MKQPAKQTRDSPDLGFDISPIDEPLGPMTTGSMSSAGSKPWTKKNFVVYIVQLAVLTIVILVALLNLSLGWQKDNKEMWVAMLSSCIGYMLPAPSYKNKSLLQEKTVNCLCFK